MPKAKFTDSTRTEIQYGERRFTWHFEGNNVCIVYELSGTLEVPVKVAPPPAVDDLLMETFGYKHGQRV